MTTRHPSGKILKTLSIVLIIATVIVAGGYASWSRYSEQVKETPPQMVTVKKGVFVHEILERGSVDSASNVDIRCQVESAGGVTILWVIPEGSIVKKGDLLVELDSSTLRENVTKQEIAVLASLSTLAESEAALATAKLVLEEYQQGKFEEEKKTIEIAKYTADEAVKTKENPCGTDYISALIEFENGSTANLTASRITQARVRTLSVTTDTNYIDMDFINQSINVHSQGRMPYANQAEIPEWMNYGLKGSVEQLFIPTNQPLQAELSHFADCINGKAKPRISGENALDALRVIWKVQQSLGLNTKVSKAKVA